MVTEPIPMDGAKDWCFKQGRHGVGLDEVRSCLSLSGRNPDAPGYMRSYYRGLSQYNKYGLKKRNLFDPEMDGPASVQQCQVLKVERLSDYPENPLFPASPADRWVPCDKPHHPMVQWGTQRMSRTAALAYPGQRWLGENLYACSMIVIDCDGDHGDGLDVDTIRMLWQLSQHTHTLFKDTTCMQVDADAPEDIANVPPSFHLTFMTDRVVPTQHYPWCHIDVLGNRTNGLRYLKDKQWNGIEPAMMTDELWSVLMAYVNGRKQ